MDPGDREGWDPAPFTGAGAAHQTGCCEPGSSMTPGRNSQRLRGGVLGTSAAFVRLLTLERDTSGKPSQSPGPKSSLFQRGYVLIAFTVLSICRYNVAPNAKLSAKV